MKRTRVAFVILILVLAAGPARAQFEITPFVGYQFGGELAVGDDDPVTHDLDQAPTWGLLFDYRVTATDYLEIYYSSQSTELLVGASQTPSVSVDHLQIGAIHEYSPYKPLRPYVGLTLGATRFDVEGGSDTRFSGSLSLGAKLIVSDHLGFRFDGRVFGISTGSGAIGCSDDLCIDYPDTSVIWQYTVNAGVIVHFGGR